MSFAYVGLGDLDATFEWMNYAASKKEAFNGWLRSYPLYEPVRADGRYARRKTWWSDLAGANSSQHKVEPPRASESERVYFFGKNSCKANSPTTLMTRAWILSASSCFRMGSLGFELSIQAGFWLPKG